MNWIRKIRVAFEVGFKVNGDVASLHDLFVSFSVDKTITSKQNPCKIQIYNLSQTHRNLVGKELGGIILEAGYLSEGIDSVGIIFSGQIREVEHSRKGANIITKIEAADGDAAYRFATARQTFRAGANVKEVVEYLYQQMQPHGVRRGEWKFPKEVKTFQRPYPIFGSAYREMDLLGQSNKFYWSIQNGKLEIIPTDGTIDYEITVSKDTGMIGIPTLTTTGCKVKTLVNPAIQPNRLIRINSENFQMNSWNNQFRISKLKVVGQNRGNQFECQIEGESLKNAETVEEGVQ